MRWSMRRQVEDQWNEAKKREAFDKQGRAGLLTGADFLSGVLIDQAYKFWGINQVLVIIVWL